MRPDAAGRPRTVLITGGASGIGAASGRRFAREGCRVWLADMSPRVDEVAEEIRSEGGLATGVRLDVTDPASIEAALATVTAEDPALDVLVSSAGIVGDVGPFESLTYDEWVRILSVNVAGTYAVLQAAVPALRAAEAPARVINLSSSAGKTGGPYTAPYNASKAAVINLTRSAAKALAPDVLVNSVCPARVDTPMFNDLVDRLVAAGAADGSKEARTKTLPIGRGSTVDEVVGVIVFLASADATFIVGEDVNVDGGQNMH